MKAFYMIKLYDLKGRFFYNPYRLEKNGGGSFFWILRNEGIIDKKRVMEHRSHQSSHVLLIDYCCSFLVVIMLWFKHWHKLFHILCIDGKIIIGVEKVNKCNMLMKKVNAIFFIIMIRFVWDVKNA